MAIKNKIHFRAIFYVFQYFWIFVGEAALYLLIFFQFKFMRWVTILTIFGKAHGRAAEIETWTLNAERQR